MYTSEYETDRKDIQSYELISVTRGTLHIQSGQRDYALSPGQFVLLFPGECHFGTRASQGELGFYWTHFHFDAEVSAVYEEPPEAALFPDESRPRYILPETGTLSANSRVNVLLFGDGAPAVALEYGSQVGGMVAELLRDARHGQGSVEIELADRG